MGDKDTTIPSGFGYKSGIDITDSTERQHSNLLANQPESISNVVTTGVYAPARTSLLNAIGAPKNENGLGLITDVLTSCIEAAAQTWPDEQFDYWLDVTKNLAKDVKARSNQAALFQIPDPCNATYLTLIKKRGFLQRSRELDAVLGRAICVAACAKHPLNSLVPDGLVGMGKRLMSGISRDPNWKLVNPSNIVDRQAITTLMVELPIKSPVRRFCGEIINILSSPIHPGIALSTPIGMLAATRETTTLLEIEDPEVEFPAHDRQEFDEENSLELDTTPDISKRLRTANFGSVASKLGLFHRDLIPPEDLAIYCRALMRQFDSDDREVQGFALLAILSMLTGCMDRVAVNLKFRHGDSIWISADCASWNWDFSKYRFMDPVSDGDQLPEPVPVYLPANIAARMRIVLNQAATEPSLGQAIAMWQGHETFDLHKFREFIRTIGDSAHPLYAGRLARSLPLVYLQVTKSDMTASLQTGRFESVAPAALYYYGPKLQTLWSRTAEVYNYLGLGEPCPISEPNMRGPCKKVVGTSDFHAKWTAFIRWSTELQKTACHQALGVSTNALNELSVALCAAFVIATGHRSTRLEELTLGALFSNTKCILINDKDDAETHRSQPRLLPRTHLINWILNLTLECLKSLLETSKDDNWIKDPNQPAFIKILPRSETRRPRFENVTTGDIRRVIQLHFGDVDSNFGRSLWVTHLDEAGCDRWLIRALTGHTRDVTKVTGAYFDIPPIVIMDRLAHEMNSVSAHLFGDLPHLKAISTLTFPLKGRTTQPAATVSFVQDPRTLIEPFDTNILIGWKHLRLLRDWLPRGDFSGHDSQAVAFLSLLCLDLIPDVPSCLFAISDPDAGFQKELGQSLIWRRPHFVHPTLLPICALTRHLISKCTEPFKNSKSIADATGVIAKQIFDSHGIPFEIKSTVQLMTAAVDAFRRMELPPSLYCVSLPQVSAPTLSPISMHRLSHGSNHSRMELNGSTLPLKWRPFPQRAAKTGDVQHLLRCLAKYSSKLEKLGEKQKRARDCREALQDDSDVIWTHFGSWLYEWVDFELVRTYQNPGDGYAVSSLATYLSVLARGTSSTDPMEWEEEDWENYITQLTKHRPASSDTMAETQNGDDAVKHALGAIARSLRRRLLNVPGRVWQFVNEIAPTTPVGSASATLILDADVFEAARLIQKYCHESPLDSLRLQLRLKLMANVPLRTSEPSSLKSDCLTPSQHLIIERGGYNSHKNANSIRLILLSDDVAEILVKVRNEIFAIKGQQTFLLRGDGTLAEGQRDAELTDLLSTILKQVTGDASARNYSMRAAAAQSLAWPEWQPFWRKAFLGEAGPIDSTELTKKWQRNWTSVGTASVYAGHGDLRSFIGNYWAGWNVIYAIHSKALMAKLPIHTGLLNACDIKSASLRQARHRSNGGSFDPWKWLDQRLCKSIQASSGLATSRKNALCAGNEKPIFRGIPKHSPYSAHIQVPLTEVNLQYLVARSLGASAFAALEIFRIPLTQANALEPMVLPVDATSMLTMRARQAPGPRGLTANLNTLSSVHGMGIIRWLVMLERETVLQVQAISQKTPMPASTRNSTLLMASSKLPKALQLQMRIGPTHVTPGDRKLIVDCKGAVQIYEDKDLGGHPVVGIALRDKENRVVASRLTSVFRVSLSTAVNILNHDRQT